VALDSPQARDALTFMRDSIYRDHVVPEAALTWHEEETRFAFQTGQAVFMRNWPYALSLLGGDDSAVAGRFAVATMPATARGRPTATLGGQQLAINANSEHPQAAWLLIDYLTRPEQMLERARVAGQLPARRSLYRDPRLVEALGMPQQQLDTLGRAIQQAVPRPVTPLYTELSQHLQEQLHRALTRQAEPAEALARAAAEIQQVLDRSMAAGRPSRP
jgi:multiple sugar transport system substrate-binding protein